MHDISSRTISANGCDALTSMLHGLRLQGLDHGRRRLDGVWTFAFPPVERAYFHIVTGDPIWLRVDGHWSELGSGDAVLLPRGNEHLLASAPDALPPPYPTWQCRPLPERDEAPGITPRAGGSHLFYGSMRFSLDRSHPLLRAMPSVLHAGSLACSEPAILPLLDALAGELTGRRVAAADMAARLADVLAIQIIRSWLEHARSDAQGWIAAARHPRIGRALVAIHTRPEDDWSVGRLAGEAGMSRSAFAAAFTSIVGDTPARYLTAIRMHLAREWIVHDGSRIADVARRLRYESEASFSRSFKRVVGVPPRAVRGT